MPNVIFIAGPNGAGKTTFANEYLSGEERQFEYINADEIARNLSGAQQSDILAARIMLGRIDQLIGTGADLVIETTLASLSYARKIPRWRQNGYRVSLIYIRLGSVSDSLERVSKRVRAGGHAIPEEVIRRRFGKSLAYLETTYKPIVDAWYIWDSGDGKFSLIESWERQ